MLPTVCRGVNATTLLTSGDLALQEAGEETGLERTTYDPPGVGFPGRGIITMSGEQFDAQYQIESDTPRTPGPPSLLLVAGSFLLLAVLGRRLFRLHGNP